MKNKQINKFFLLIPAGVILAGVLLFLGLRNSGNDTDCQNTVATLQTLENSDISETEQKLQDLKAQETQDATEVTTLLTDVQLRQVFAGSVILGDSITNSIVEYGYLDTDVVVAKLGLSVAGADEQIDTAIGLKPTHVFMAFGSNDLETYGSNSSEFIAAYKTQIQKIQAALPTSTVSCRSRMMPSQPPLIWHIIPNTMMVFRPCVRKWDVLLLITLPS